MSHVNCAERGAATLYHPVFKFAKGRYCLREHLFYGFTSEAAIDYSFSQDAYDAAGPNGLYIGVSVTAEEAAAQDAAYRRGLAL